VDHEALRRWIDESPGNEAVFRACFKAWHESRQVAFAGRWDEERAWRRLLAGLDGRRRARARRWTRRAVAATVAGIAGALFYFLPGERPGEAVQVSREFPAGSSRAELTLASGERIALDRASYLVADAGDGARFQNDTLASRLRYDAGDEGEGEARYHLLSVPKGGEYSLALPDGTVAWLNSESTLRFPARFGEGRREVYLEGEAYFEVAREEGRPFSVHAGDCDITVTGTTFNASAYRGDRAIQVTLASGAIRVASGGREIALSPGEQCVILPATGETSVERVDARLYTSWVEGKFYFSGYTFEELVRKLERWYDFTMVYATEDIKGMRFSGAVNKHQPLDEMLRFLEMTRFIRFSIEGRTVTAYRMHGR
jgi:ferric-dicitrate binding protein FerR (iron transport regulator)